MPTEKPRFTIVVDEDLFKQMADGYSSDKNMYAAYLKMGSMPFTLLEKYLIPDNSI